MEAMHDEFLLACTAFDIAMDRVRDAIDHLDD